jgi:hypothetical protein
VESGEGEQGEGRWRTAGFFPFIVAEGGEGRRPVVKAEELPALMG